MAAKQRGVGLIEVLVSLLILAIAVLGFAGLQLKSLQASGEAHYRVQASAIAQDLSERIKINRTQVAYYRTAANWTNATQTKPADTCITGTCTDAGMATFDLAQATYAAQSLLPDGRIRVEPCQVPNTMTCIYIAWAGTQPTAGNAGECVNASGSYVNGANCVMQEVR